MNLKHHFYKAYYQGMDPRIFEENNLDEKVEKRNLKLFEKKNNILFDSRYPVGKLGSYQLYEGLSNVTPISMVTTYPGLVIGTGYTHETKSKGELKLGFHFDHTSGLPEIPGHSVKGIIRNAFPRRDQPQTKEPLKLKKAKADFIIQLLGLDKNPTITDRLKWVTILEKQIFENISPATMDMDDKTTVKSDTSADVFFPAYITKPGKGNAIIGPDTLTPHGDNPLKNPTPLPFLKVLPDVTWSFNFQLFDTKIGDVEVTADAKRQLFKQILLLLGAGAKTNVGYGHFESSEDADVLDQIPNYQFPKPETADNQPNNNPGNTSSGTNKTEEKKTADVKPRHPHNTKPGKEITIDGVVLNNENPYEVDLYMAKEKIEKISLTTHRNYKKGQVIQVRLQVKKDGSINGKVTDQGLKKSKK